MSHRMGYGVIDMSDVDVIDIVADTLAKTSVIGMFGEGHTKIQARLVTIFLHIILQAFAKEQLEELLDASIETLKYMRDHDTGVKDPEKMAEIEQAVEELRAQIKQYSGFIEAEDEFVN